MQDFMRKWTGVIVLILGICVLGFSVVALVLFPGEGVLLEIIAVITGLAIIFTGLAIHGMTDGMNQIGDVLAQIMKGLQER